mgnify:CR=1 FL=1
MLAGYDEMENERFSHLDGSEDIGRIHFCVVLIQYHDVKVNVMMFRLLKPKGKSAEANTKILSPTTSKDKSFKAFLCNLLIAERDRDREGKIAGLRTV